MKGTLRKLGITAVSAMLLFALAACGGPKVDGTYTVTYDSETLASSISHNGFLMAAGISETNTLTLEGGNYTYTKVVESAADSEFGVKLSYTFKGTYTSKDTTVTLSVPTDGSFDENWGMLNGQFFTNTSGTLNDTVLCKDASMDDGVSGDGSHDPSHFFNGPYYSDSGSCVEQVVTVDTANGTLSYVSSATSDDD